MNQIKLSKDFDIPAIDYAAQGNSLLGIRGSGKTYTGTKIAEELTAAGIPWIAIDPTGIWQNLRYGKNEGGGLPILVVGGLDPDVPLSEDNVDSILTHVADANVSVIFDLRKVIDKDGKTTSTKAAWRRIVLKIVNWLMENNDWYEKIRHVFIEEAAEFVPQRINEGGAVVYGAIESMARIGRNYGIGYTLINQRAEEIAKAVFELCEQVIIHRQAGKNSLKSISDWLDIKGADKSLVKSLPSLGNGEAWVINEKGEMCIKVLPKKTFHPNPKDREVRLPKDYIPDNTVIINLRNALSEAVSKMETPIEGKPFQVTDHNAVKHLQRIEELKDQNREYSNRIIHLELQNEKLKRLLQTIQDALRNGYNDVYGNDEVFLNKTNSYPPANPTETIAN
jgi:hypothetical protein